MSADVKTDNDNLPAKIAVRRHLLQRYHADGDIRVFDACQGSGVIWKKLREEFKVSSYWGSDLKRKSGRITRDSVDLLAAGLSENVIDVDTYGSPWGHWLEILKNLTAPTTVFLTIGLKSARSNRPLSIAEAEALGIGKLYQRTPHKLRLRLARVMFPQMLARAELLGVDLVEVVEGARGASARYLGIRIAPKVPTG
tara:strand:- start:7673 stop:8263 length:591 start_codon:yes stop_codon:yes gene_type:complete